MEPSPCHQLAQILEIYLDNRSFLKTLFLWLFQNGRTRRNNEGWSIGIKVKFGTCFVNERNKIFELGEQTCECELMDFMANS